MGTTTESLLLIGIKTVSLRTKFLSKISLKRNSSNPLRSSDGLLPEQTHAIRVWIYGYENRDLGKDWWEDSDLDGNDPQREWGEKIHPLTVEKSHTDGGERPHRGGRYRPLSNGRDDPLQRWERKHSNTNNYYFKNQSFH